MRLFIAIELPEPWRGEIAQWMKSLAQAIPDPQHRLRWVKEDQLHLTLKFLGETSESQIPSIGAALKAAAARQACFSFNLSKVGHFAGRVVWLGAESGRDSVARLADAIEAGCASLGFPLERRTLQPHITLARAKINSKTNRLARLPFAVLHRTFGPVSVSEVCLVRSTLTPRGSLYETLGRYPLAT